MNNFSFSFFSVVPATSKAKISNAARPLILSKYCRIVCALLLLSLASTTRSYAAGATYTGTLGGTALVAGNVCQGTGNALVYSFSLAQSTNTNDIEGFKFTTTAGATTTVGSYNVYLAPSTGNTLSVVPTSAFLLGTVANTGPGTLTLPTWYSATGPTYYPLTSGNTYYVYITANILATAAVGATVQVTAPTGSTTASNPNDGFNWLHNETGAGTAPAGVAFTVSSCPCTSYFSYTGGPTTAGGAVQIYTVPAGCSNLSVTVAGARGGDGEWTTGRSIGGNGGIVTSTLNVTPATQLQVYVGGVGYSSIESGTVGTPGGSNSGGGATGGAGTEHQGGGGGGASDIRGTAGSTTSALLSRVVTGGGGGGGCYNGSASAGGGGGYNGGTGGADGEYNSAYNAAEEGFPGSTTAGGAVPADGGSAGSLGAGGSCSGTNGAAGGGAGYYGASGTFNGGGCGGSSDTVSIAGIATVGATVFTDGNSGTSATYTGNWGSGYVQITPKFTVTGGGSYCAGSAGEPVGLSGSITGATYTLYNGASVVTTAPGTGSAITFGTYTAAGTYTVTETGAAATGTQTVNMIGSTTITILALPAGISGNTGGICVAGTLSLSDVTGAGTWASITTAVATVGSGSGLVTAVSPGTSTIIFTLTSSGCTANTVVTVNPPAAITGITTLCGGGGTTILSDLYAGGAWASSNTANATASTGSSTSTITGASLGTATISYTIGSCTTTLEVTVTPSPAALGGSTFNVCTGNTITLTESVPGGTWSSSSAIATVDGSGDVSGVLPGGTVTISYTGCGGSALAATQVVTVNPTPGIPTAIVNGTITPSSIAISWTESGSPTSYTISVYTNAGLTIPAAGYTYTVTGTSAVIGGLSAATQYWYTVTASTIYCTSATSASQNGITACNGTPVAGTSAVSPLTGVNTTPFTLTLTGYTVAGGITFQWQSASSGTGPWTNITGATNTTYNFTGITANTYYQCIVTCSGTSSATSTVSEALLLGCTATAASWLNAAITNTYSYTGTMQTWVVPAGVSTVTAACSGGNGGLNYYAFGATTAVAAEGGYISAVLTVTPTTTLNIFVGGAGGNGTGGAGGTAGYNGGATGGYEFGDYQGGGGGGASDIRFGGVALSNRIIVAGGGGGAGENTGTTTDDGGAGGGPTGGSAAAGTGTSGGGGGGTAGGGGSRGDYLGDDFGTAGSLGTGGAPDYSGGGGGGGYYGGGGGAFEGGGGGSSWTSGTSIANTTGGSVGPGNGLVTISYSFPSEAATYGVNTFTVSGSAGTSLNDAGMVAAAGTGTGYINRLSLSPMTLFAGGSYASSITWGTPVSYQEAQVWIDFNNNGTFEASEQVTAVVGYSTSSTPSPTNFNITIPSGSATGLHLMRIRGIVEYNGGTLALSSALDPCLDQYLGTGPTYNDGDEADYTVNIQNTPVASVTPTSLNFGTIPLSTTSAAQSFSVTASYLSPASGSLTVNAPTDYLVSLTGTSGWASTVSIPYTGGSLSSYPVYVEFTAPGTSGIYTGSVTVTGGYLATTLNVAVTGIAANPCTGAPTAGTTTVTPGSGAGGTVFTLSLTGYSLGTGISFQWQSSATGTGGWTNISGATNQTYTFTGISANTFYQCIVTCANSGLSATSSITEAFLLVCTSTAASWVDGALTNTFSYVTTTAQRWPVPINVASIMVNVEGAQGGGYYGYSDYGSLGGYGGQVIVTTGSGINVTTGHVLDMWVGGKGSNTGAGGWPGGGSDLDFTADDWPGAGGGGYSAIVDSNISTILVVAGGGGGGGGDAEGANGGGAGGGLTGGGSLDGASGGGNTSTLTGGTGTNAGGYLTGGSGAGAYGSGGGGGGYYGGGGGGNQNGGGGAGGSAYVNPTYLTGTATYNTGVNGAGTSLSTPVTQLNGTITINYLPSPESPSFGINTFSVTAASGPNLSDAGMAAAAAAGTGYINRIGLSPITLYTGGVAGATYASSVTWAIPWAYQEAQVWIDFNNDGTFQTSEQVSAVVGYSATSTTSPTNFNITVPNLANPGSHLMRVRGIMEYSGGTLALSTSLDPCLSQFGGTGPQYNDGDEADYIVNISCNTPALNGVPTLCAAATTSLSDAVTTGAWSSSNTSVATVSSGIVTGVSSGTTTISYTLSNGCAVNKILTVYALPVVSVTPPSLTRCSLDPANLLTASGASTYVWSPGGATTSTLSVSPTTTTTYSVVGSNGVCSMTVTVLVSVNQTPTVNATPTSAIYCAGGGPAVSSTAGGSAVSTYIWSPSTGLSCTACTTTSASPTTSIVYSVTGTTAAGCSAVATFSVSGGIQPTVNISPANITRCSADAGNLITASGVSSSYTWSPATALSATTGSSVTANPTATITYSVTGVNGACSATNTILVSVNTTPTISGITPFPPTGLCYSSSASETQNYNYSTTSSPNNYALTWQAGSGLPNVSPYSSLPSPISVIVPPGTPAAIYTGTVTVENSTTGCSSVAAMTLTINPLPVPSFTDSAGTTACSNVTVTYATQPGEGLYEWGFPSETSGVDYNIISGGGPGNDTVKVQWLTTGSKTISINYYASPGNCTAATPTSNTVNVIASPTAIASNSSPLCATGTVSLTATPSGSTAYSWTGSDGFTSTLQNPIETPTVTGTITYSLTVSNAGCSPTTVFTTIATVNPTPSSTGPSNGGPICNGGTVALTAHSNISTTIWSWTGSDGSSSALQNPIESPTSTATYSLTVSGIGSGCQPATIYTTTVTVNPAPTSTGPGNTSPLCLGGTVGLSANSSNAITWSWAGSDGSSSAAQNPIFTPTVVGTITYSLTLTNGAASGCNPGIVYTTIVTVNPTPAAFVSNNGPICVVGSATLTATPSGGANTYLWSGPGLSSTVVQDPVATPTVTSTYSLTVSNSGGVSGCSPTTVYTTTVTVNNPTAVVSNNGPICSVATVTLTATPSGGVTGYLWSGSNLSSTTAQNPTATPTVTSTYSLTVSMPGCSPATIYTTQVTVTPAPTAGPTNTGPICNSGTVTLNANPVGGATGYSWSGPNLSSSILQNPTATPTVTSTYSLTVSSTGCFPTAVYTTTVTVNGLPTASPTNNGPICLSASVTLTANPGGSTDIYLWSGPALSSTTAQNPTATPTVTSTYSLTVSSNAGTSGCTPGTVYTTTVTVNSVAAATPSQSGPICTTGTVDLFANPVGGTASVFTWSGSSLSSTSIANPTANPPLGNNVYTLTVSAPGCTASTYTIAVTVDGQPTLSGLSSSASNPFCGGGTMTLNVTPAGGAGTPTYTWSGPGISTTTSSTNSAPFTTATGAATGAYSVSLAYSASGCVTTSTVSASYTLDNQPTITALSSSASNPFCSGAAMTFSVTGSGGAGTPTYTWSGPDIATTTGASNVSPSIVSSGGAATGAYSVTLAYTGTGCNTTLPFTTGVYTVAAQPTITSLASSASNPFCAGASMTFTVSGSAGGAGNATYTWTGPDIATTTGASNVSSSITTTGASVSGAYSVILSYSGTGCNATSPVSTGVYTATAQPTITGLTSSASNPFCAGASMTFTVSGSAGGAGNPTYTWSGPDITATTGASNISSSITTTGTSVIGAYSVTLSYSGTGCNASLPATTGVYTASAQPSITGLTSSASNPFCAGASMTFTVSGSAGGAGNPTYTWSGPDIATTTGASNISSLITTTGSSTTGAYSVTLGYNGTGCNTTLPATTGVYTASAQPAITGLTSSASNPFCTGATMTFTVSGSTGGAGNATYTWSGPDIPTTTGASNVSSLITSSGGAATGAYSVTLGYSGTGCNLTLPVTTATYTVTPDPNVTALVSSATNPMCVGATMTLTATSGGGAGSPTYTWSGPDIATVTSATNVSPSLTLTGGPTTGAYSVIATYTGSGCSSSPFATGVFSVNVQPSVTSLTTPNGNPFCAGSNLVLTSTVVGGSGYDTYTWSGPGIATTTGTSDISPTFNPTPGIGAYSVNLTDNGTGCNSAAQATAATYTVMAAPTTPTVTTTDAGTTFCGSEVLLASNGGSGNLYFQGTNPAGTSTLTPTGTATVTATGTYYFNAQLSGGCWGNAGSITVTINAVPSAAPTNTGYICSGGTVTLNAVPGTNTTNFTWTGPNLLSGASSATATADPTATGANTYSLTVSDGSGDPGCSPSMVYTTVVTVNTIAIAPTNTSIACSGGSVTLNPVETGSAPSVSYAWSGPLGYTSTAASPVLNPVNTAMSGTYTVTASSAGSGCTVTSTTVVTVDTLGVTATNNGYACSGSSINLSSGGYSTAPGTSYAWSGPLGYTSTTSNPVLNPVNTAMSGTYTVTISAVGSGCNAISSTNVSVDTLAVAPTNTSYACSGGSVTLHSGETGTAPSVTYAWSGPLGYTSTANSPVLSSVNTAMGGAYTVTATSAGSGCSATSTTNVTIDSIAVAPTNTSFACSGGSVTLSSGGYSTAPSTSYAWSGPLGYTSASSNPVLNPVNTAMTGTYTVTASSAGSGCSATSTTAVTVDTLGVTASNNSYACSGGSVNLSSGGYSTAPSTTYAWSGPLGYTSATSNPVLNPVNTAMTGTYIVTIASTGSGCSATSTTNVTVDTLAVAPTNTSYACSGGSVTLNSGETGTAPSVTYAWSGPLGYTSASSNPVLNPVNTAMTGTYTVIATSAGSGCSATSTTNVTVDTIAVAPTNTSIACSGGSVSLSSGGYSTAPGTTYAWSGPLGYTSASSNPVLNPVNTAMTGTYTVIATSAGSGCSATSTTAVIVDTLGVTASNNGYACSGGTIDLSSGGYSTAPGTSYAWSGPLGYTSATSNPVLNPINTAMSGTYTVTVSATGSGCSSTSTTSVTVDTLAVAATNNSYACSGGTVDMFSGETGTAPSVTYAWSGPLGYTSASSNPVLNPVNTAMAGTYTVTATSAGSGCSATSTTSVTVDTIAVAPTNNSYACSGGTVDMFSGESGTAPSVTYAWIGPLGYTSASSNPVLNPVNTAMTGTYTVTASSAGSGCSATSTTNVTIDTIAVTPTNSSPACVGGTVTLAAGESGSAPSVSYAWNGPAAFSSTAANDTLNTVTSANAGTYTVTVTSSGSGCSATGTTVVTINPTPAVDTIYNTGYICNGGTVTLIPIPATFNTTAFAWSGPNLIATTGNPTTAMPTVTSTYTLTVSDGTSNSGCSPSTQYYTTVDVHITPAAAPSNNGPICIGGTVDLIANETPNVLTYSWSGVSLSSSSIADPTATPTANSVYTLTVTDGSLQSGCAPTTQYYDTVVVKGTPSVTVSNNGPICATNTLILTASGQANVTNYTWSGPAGVIISNDTSAIASVLNATTTATGTYTVTVIDSIGSGCTAMFTTQATVNPLPTVYNMTGGGHYCDLDSGVHIGLSGSDTGITYVLYYNGGSLGASPGTGNPIDFGLFTTAGAYSVSAYNNITLCPINMNGLDSVIINPLPTKYAVLGSGTSYCANGPGIDVSLGNSEDGINYQLYRGSIPQGSPVGGDADSISFGLQTIAGDYMVFATDTTTGCWDIMLGAAEIIVDSVPNIYTVSGGGAYCAGGGGVNIALSGSDTGITYSLINIGVDSASVTGSGFPLSYNSITTAGHYIVLATNNTTTCYSYMADTAQVSINPLPTVDTVTGGGTYCQGTPDIIVGLNASSIGVNYRLYNGATLADTAMGSGALLSFGVQPFGTYTVTGFNATTGCTSNMYGSATVSMNPAPAIYSITGIGNYCANLAGVNLGLSGSDTGITYTLYNSSATVTATSGSGSALSFGVDTSGTYSVIASNNITSCTSVMAGSGVVNVNALPAVYDVTGGGPYCAGSGGVPVGVSASNPGIKYYLYNGSSVVDSALSTGTSAVTFGSQTAAGTYTVNAINVSTSCTSNMADSAVVTVITPVTPSLTVTTGMGDTVCLGNNITFTANPTFGGSTPAYQWYVNGTNESVSSNTYNYVPTNGDVVKAVLISSAACATPDTVSASATMTVDTQAIPSVSISVDPGTLVCAGTVVTFNAVPAYGGTLPIYSWKVNGGSAIAGQEYVYTPANGDHVSVELTSNFACATVDTAIANVVMNVGTATVPTVEIIANPGTNITTGQVDTLTAYVTNAGSNVSYQWVVNSSVIAAATNSVYESTFNNNDSVTCQVINNNGCNLEGFNSVTIYVTQLGINTVTFGTGDIRLIPNPNQGTFSIKGTLGTTADEEITMEVTDILGQVVYKNKVLVHNGIIDQNVQLSTTLANGMYMMNLRSGSDSKVIHFVIEQ